MVLNREDLRQRIEEGSLITHFIDLETQLQPAGFDVTVDEIHSFDSGGSLDFSNGEREIPGSTPVEPEVRDGDEYGWWSLDPGVYKVVMNERVEIPEDVVGIANPRSSLLRMGCTTENALWDPGYEGGGEFVLKVDNPDGVEIKENARINQITFLELDETEGYSGIYGGEA
jgi:dUTP pyrophosphatase